MKLPNDPMILLSVVNTYLRDRYPDLDKLCEDYGMERSDIEQRLNAVGFSYDESTNQFK